MSGGCRRASQPRRHETGALHWTASCVGRAAEGWKTGDLRRGQIRRQATRSSFCSFERHSFKTAPASAQAHTLCPHCEPWPSSYLLASSATSLSSPAPRRRLGSRRRRLGTMSRASRTRRRVTAAAAAKTPTPALASTWTPAQQVGIHLSKGPHMPGALPPHPPTQGRCLPRSSPAQTSCAASAAPPCGLSAS